MSLADTVRSFRQDADLEVCLDKCIIYMPSIQEDRARQLIRECIEMNASGTLEPLLPMLAPNLDVIQVHGLCVVGISVGSFHYIRAYVREKCGTICNNVEKVRVCADSLIRFHLLKFCMNTRLSFLSRNATPDNMATSSEYPANKGPVHVDQKIVNEVLSAGDTAKNLSLIMLNWCKFIVQFPHHKGGYAITRQLHPAMQSRKLSIRSLPGLSRCSQASLKEMLGSARRT